MDGDGACVSAESVEPDWSQCFLCLFEVTLSYGGQTVVKGGISVLRRFAGITGCLDGVASVTVGRGGIVLLCCSRRVGSLCASCCGGKGHVCTRNADSDTPVEAATGPAVARASGDCTGGLCFKVYVSSVVVKRAYKSSGASGQTSAMYFFKASKDVASIFARRWISSVIYVGCRRPSSALVQRREMSKPSRDVARDSMT